VKRPNKKAGEERKRLPAFCDNSCPHARFAPTEASGACRREQAVYCALFKKYNNKNSACLERK
jgi:nitrite reductase/ring-hydroxylating ferredoxin subunit